MNSKLTVIIIAKNAANQINRCLDSIKWADEIIVLDSGSNDKTIEICKNYTQNVFSTDWPGFGIQKNRALDKASNEWVLSIDTDEWLSEELQQEIKLIIKQNHNYSYQFTRKSYYCGKLINFGHWRGDKVLRLFKAASGKFTNNLVHEKLVVNNKIINTKGLLLHEPFISHDQVINKMNNYSSLSALERRQAGKSGGLTKALTHGIWMFIKSYILKLGFLDGKQGFMLAISAAEGCYYRYLKI